MVVAAWGRRLSQLSTLGGQAGAAEGMGTCLRVRWYFPPLGRRLVGRTLVYGVDERHYGWVQVIAEL